jgi:hypothetical protein
MRRLGASHLSRGRLYRGIGRLHVDCGRHLVRVARQGDQERRDRNILQWRDSNAESVLSGSHADGPTFKVDLNIVAPDRNRL